MQLLQKIKQVNFTLYKSHISFDATGDIRKGYNIVMWNWNGPSWAFGVIGTFRVNPDRLSVDDDKILWHTEDGQVLFCIQILLTAYCQASYIPTTAGSGVFPHGRTKPRADRGGRGVICALSISFHPEKDENKQGTQTTSCPAFTFNQSHFHTLSARGTTW